MPQSVSKQFADAKARMDNVVNSSNIVTSTLSRAILANNGALSSSQLNDVAATVAGSKQSEADMKAVEDLEYRISGTGQKFTSVKEAIANNMVSGVFKQEGLPNLNDILGDVGNDAAKAADYVGKLGFVSGKIPESAKKYVNAVTSKLSKIVWNSLSPEQKQYMKDFTKNTGGTVWWE
jgi:hypothetical protein